MKKTAVIAASFLLLVTSLLPAEITFSTPYISETNGILFEVTHNKPGEPSYPTFFTAQIEGDFTTPQQITTYPEQLSSLLEGKALRIKNRYGTTHYNVETGALLHGLEQDGEIIPTESVIPAAESVSPDGKWVCSIQRTGAVTGSIILKNAAGYTQVELVDTTELSFTQVPVRWSPDSKFLIYEKQGNLYFTEPEAMFKTNQVAEHLRKVGPGTINCVDWASDKNLVYITNDLVYRIPIYEMYTRALYSDFVGIGSIVGRLPHPISPTDTFSVNGDCTAMVMAGHQRTISYFSLPGSASFVRQMYTGTQVSLVGATQNCQFFWDSWGNPVLWFQYHTVGHTDSQVYRLEIHSGQVRATVLEVPENAMEPLLSPDKMNILCRTGEQLIVYSLQDWHQVAVLDCTKVIDYDWGNNDTVFIGTQEAVLEWSVRAINQKGVQVLFPVSASAYSWNATTGHPILQTPWGIMEYNQDAGKWSYSELAVLDTPKNGNSKYRVFLDASPNKNFTNMPYIRTLTGSATTKPFYEPATQKQEKRPQVALAFDALDNADGLATILHILEKYNVSSTFFINGEFIRRYPAETSRIVEAGQECGSMFYTALDLTSNEDFLVDVNFIRRGLARNEDEFYDLTEKELSVLWHAPFYTTNKAVLEAGDLAGYTYVDRSMDPLDTITFEQAAVKDISTYKTATMIIQQIVSQLEDGMVIPVAVGVSGGSRKDFLYDKLDLLLVAILDAGYDIVSVTQLLQE
ncbi:MAG: polysaccharide deacetylase family protein [Treponema sp.]|nr:polysaccharide deacetylase family protein [Treponema sp.]